MEVDLSAEQVRGALRRVLSSRAFSHSDNLRRLLSYLGDKSLSGSDADLKEYTLGVEAFHKPPDYDTQHDATVRVLASKLRQKLEDYYLKEGRDDPVRIEIPKGHYRLICRPRRQTDRELEARVLTARIRRWRLVSAGLAILAGILIFITAASRLGTVRQAQSPAPILWTPELELVWKSYLQSRRPTMIVLGTPLFTKFSGGFFRDPKINVWEKAEDSDKLRKIKELLESEYAVPWQNFTGIGEATGAFLLCKLLQSRRPNLIFTRSSVLSWEDIQDSDMVFLGSPKFNVQLDHIPLRRDLVIEGGVIRNLRPGPGESPEYRDVWKTKAELSEDYALVERSRGLHGRGEIMVLASSSTEGTWAAVEYMTGASHAKDLVSRLGLSSGGLPRGYQVVIKAEFKEQVPVKISYIIHRVTDETPQATGPVVSTK